MLGLRADRVRAWLDGYERKSVVYPPMIRAEPAGDDVVTRTSGAIKLAGDIGRPSVQGVATERLWELHDAGESIAGLARGYEMAEEQVRSGVAYHEQQRSLAA